jgi:hypothetical protein
VKVDHVLLTRFNLPSPGPESYIRAQDGWLQNRVELFERYTVPSVRQQTATGRFSWLVFLDSQSPRWLLDRLAPVIAAGLFHPVYGEEFSNEIIVAEARALSGQRSEMLVTTNLDNDDAIAADFVERLQELVVPGRRTALYLADGLIVHGHEAYLRHDPANAFVSVAEPWDGAESVWCEWHNLLAERMPVRSAPGRPAWLQVVHGRNVSNRVRGRLADPRGYRDLFAGLIDDIPAPSRLALLRDHVIEVPVRESREAARRVAKTALMRTVGKGGLDRLKEALQARSAV